MYTSVYCMKKHYIEVDQGTIFMERNKRFGLILDRLEMIKKKFGAIMSRSDYEQLLEAFFFYVFMCKIFFNLFTNIQCNVRTKKLHKIC